MINTEIPVPAGIAHSSSVNCSVGLAVLPMRVPNWIEGPTDLEPTEFTALLAELAGLKDRGLTAQVVVIDFVCCNM